MPTHKAKRRFTPTTSTVPLAPKNSTPKLLIHNVLFYNRESPSRTPEKRLDCHRITLCTIAAQTRPLATFNISILISIVAGENHKKPHHPSKVQGMNCFYGQCQWQEAFVSLHYTLGATLRFATLRSIPFIVSPSLGNPRKSASLIPFRSCLPVVPLRFPFAVPTHNPNETAKT